MIIKNIKYLFNNFFEYNYDNIFREKLDNKLKKICLKIKQFLRISLKVGHKIALILHKKFYV